MDTGARKVMLFSAFVTAAVAADQWVWAFAGLALYAVINTVLKFRS